MNKFYFIIFFILFFVEVNQSQVEGFGLVCNNRLIVGGTEVDLPRNYFKNYNDRNNSAPLFTKISSLIKSSKYEFPFCWDAFKDTVFVVVSRQVRGFREEVHFSQWELSKLTQVEVNLADSLGRISLDKNAPDFQDKIKIIGDELMKDEIKRNFRTIRPVSSIFDELHGTQGEQFYLPLKDKDEVTYDFVTLNRDTHLFFVRDGRKLSVWKYAYPVIRQKNEDSDWQEVITYTSDSIYVPPEKSFYYKPNYAFHASKEKTICSAIDDTLFFKGHFKAIRQDGETYLINLKHGAIYHLQEKKIVRIGKLDVGNQKFAVPEGQLFIEDRDNRRLIFFGKVKQEGRPEKFPRFIEILTKEDLRTVFPNIYEIFIPVDQH